MILILKQNNQIFKIFISLILFLILGEISFAETNSWSFHNNGLFGGHATTLAIASTSNDQIIYVGTLGGGIFKSTNSGSNWDRKNKGLFNWNVNCITIHPNNTDIILVGTKNGLFISDDSGENWRFSFPNNLEVLSLLFFSGDILFAGTTKGLWRSDDCAKTWKNLDEHKYINAIFTGKDDTGEFILVGTHGKGIWKYRNLGEVEEDGSKSGTADRIVCTFIQDPVKSGTIYTGTDKQVLMSNDYGENWEEFGTGINDIVISFAINQNINSGFFAGTESNGIYSWQGNKWQKVEYENSTMPFSGITNLQIIRNNNDLKLLAATGGGVFTASVKDVAKGWSPRNDGLEALWIRDLEFVQNEDSLILLGAAEGGLYGSELKYQKLEWKEFKSQAYGKYIFDILNDTKKKSLYLATQWMWGVGEGSLQIIDWKKNDQTKLPNGCNALYLDTLSDYGNSKIIVGTDEGIYSRTAPFVWQLNSSDPYIRSLAIFPDDQNNKYYAGTYGGGLLEASNWNADWKKVDGLNEFNIHAILINSFKEIPRREKKILIGTDHGVYCLENGRWMPSSNPQLNFLRVNVLKTMQTEPKLILAGTEGGGIYLSRNGGERWECLNYNLSEITSLSDLSILSIISNKNANNELEIYIGTNGCGVLNYTLCEPIIAVEGSLTFPKTRENKETHLDLLIKNQGSASLNVKCFTLCAKSRYFVSPDSFTIRKHDSSTINVTFKPDSAFFFQDSLIIYSNDPYQPRIAIPLTGEGIAPRILVENEYDFGKVRVGQSKVWPMIISNAGNDTLIINEIHSPLNDYTYEPKSNIKITPAESCIIKVTFRPISLGDRPDVLTIETDTWGEKTVNLKGKGIAPEIYIYEKDKIIDFGTGKVLNTKEQVVSIINNGEDVLAISNMSFSQYPNIYSVFPSKGQIAPRCSLDIKINFKPLSGSVYSDNLSIISDSYHNGLFADTTLLSVSGTGISENIFPIMAVNRKMIEFNKISIGQAITDTISVKNSGSAPLNFGCSGIGDPNVFVVDPLKGSVACNDSIFVKVTFIPESTFFYQDSLIISGNDPDTPRITVYLSGEGIAPKILVDNEYDFGEVEIGKFKSWDMIIRNAGTDELLIDSITNSLPDIFTCDPRMNISLVSGETQTIRVTFKPLAAIKYNDTLHIQTNAWGEKKVTLCGTGVDKTITDTEPPKIIYSQKNFYAQRGLPIQINNISISDNSGLHWKKIFFKQGGRKDYISIGFENESVMIPGEFVTSRGIEYYISAQDKAGNSSCVPENGSEFFSICIEFDNEIASDSAGNVLELKGGEQENCYQMISIPFILNSPDAKSVLIDDLGPDNCGENWRLIEYRDNKYYDYPDINAFMPGRGF